MAAGGRRPLIGAVRRERPAAGRLLEVRDLRVRFTTAEGDVDVVDGISFEVGDGEVLGIVGESGCGKTVTALSLLGLLPEPPARIAPGSSVLFRGEQLVGAGERRLRRLRGNAISMVFQEPMTSLNPVLPVGEQVAEGLRHHRGLSRREARGEALRLLEEVGLGDASRTLDAYPHELSGGMRQRVLIAMALACDPDLLIADEPTTALDVTTQAQILRLLAELRERRGLALVLVTHDLALLAEVAGRVAVMYAGQIVESGPLEEVFETPLHPYTRGLLDSTPGARGAGGRLAAIPGTVPPPHAWAEGCRFRERCPIASDGCEARQSLTAPEPQRSVRCWKAGAAPAAGA